MSTLLLTLSTEALDRAIADLGARAADIETGTEISERRFDHILDPEMDRAARLARLNAVREELALTSREIAAERDPPELSAVAIMVLGDYSEGNTRFRIDIPHVPVPPGLPCLRLAHAAENSLARMRELRDAILDETDPPDITFYAYLAALEDEIEAAGLDVSDEWLLDATIGYLQAIVDHPDLAWSGDLEIPEILAEHVLDPSLAETEAALRTH